MKTGDFMLWSELFNDRQEPLNNEIKEYVNTPLWDVLADYLQETYNVKPKLFYSCCSMDKGSWKGWNVKYKKSSKSLCTLYPKQGYFTALITVSGKSHVIEVTNESTLRDLKELIALQAGYR
jgi:AraC family transcriptional regulator